MGGSERYCEHCDQPTAEWSTGPEGNPTCPSCGGSLYESKAAYTAEMVRWMGDRYGLSEGEVRRFLSDHGNPGKGQAAALMARGEGP